MGDDIVQGSYSGRCIIRGGKGDDALAGGKNIDLLIGDYGKDILTGDFTAEGGRDYFVFRTDKEGSLYNNLHANKDEVDTVMDFKTGEDYIVIPGIGRLGQIQLEEVANTVNDYYVKIVYKDSSYLYAGRVNSDGALNTTRDFVIGNDADKIYSIADGDDPSSFFENSSVFDVMA